MIFHLNIAPAELQNLPASEVEELLSEVARSSRSGFHIFVLERSLAKYAFNNSDLSTANRAEYQRLHQAATQNFALLGQCQGHVQICVGNSFHFDPENQIWTVGHQRALVGNLLQVSKLILEDAYSDGAVYRKVLKDGTNTGKSFELRFEECHGGGSQTFRSLRTQILAGSVSICICDHDRHSPQSAPSDTFNKTANEAEKATFVGMFYQPPFRELENLFPLQVVRAQCPQVSPDKLDELEALIAAQDFKDSGDCLWLYFDVKEGVEGKKFIKKCPQRTSKIWFSRKYCQGKVEKLDSVSFPGFGENIVTALLDSGPAMKEFHRYLRSKYWSFHLQPFFEEVAWKLVGAKETRL
jgi:hypothetical protein